LSVLEDERGRRAVRDLVPNAQGLYPVGRLDYNSEGLLLLTDDGELTQKILHPSHETTKTYEVLVKGVVAAAAIKKLEQGVEIDGRRTWPAKILQVKKLKSASRFSMIIHEGRKRQVRRMCEAVGHPVINLKRIAYGKLQLGDLKSGSYRFLGAEDLKKALL
jgi:23S rRNA pseudouridine2605 synthase